MKKTQEELHKCCDELKEIRKKYANKRSGYTNLPYLVLRKKYKLWIPPRYLNNKKPIIRKVIYLLVQRAYLMGKLEAMRENKVK